MLIFHNSDMVKSKRNRAWARMKLHGIWNFSLFIIPMLREIVLQILSIWSFQESLLSTIIPRNLMWETFSKGVSSKIISIGKASNVLLKSMYFVFWRLSDNLLALIHWVTCFNSELTVCTRVFGLLWEKNTFESSAKSINERTTDDLKNH